MDADKREEIIQLGEEANRLLTPGSLFNRVVKTLTSQYIQELMAITPGELTATGVHAKLIALNDITRSLKVLSDDLVVLRDKENRK